MSATTTPQAATRRGYLIWILLGLLAALILPNLVQRIQYSATRGAEEARLDVAREKLPQLAGASEAFRLVAQTIGPCVVHIDTTRVSHRQVPLDRFGFWTGDQVYESQGQGSGVIVDAAGYVITNNHVIEGAAQIQVKLSDGRTIENVAVVGADPLTDLAVLKIEADDLHAAPWGKSSELEVGDWVLAVGNPYGLDRTVTQGIISAKQRRVRGGARPLDFLQTDAAVNPGNSGGPLVNLKGQIVGITTAIVGSAYQGISFAIPSDLAREVYDQLRKGTGLSTGWIGVAVAQVTPVIAQQLQLPTTKGALITQVQPGSPAAAAGIAIGDVVLAWDGVAINESGELLLLAGQTQIGKSVDVVLVRDGQQQVVKVQVQALPNNNRAPSDGR